MGANGKEWSVEIGGPGKLLGFKSGWKNFVASTSVKRGEQMLFALISKSCFSVHMFNKLGVEVVPAPPVDTKYTTTPTTGKRKRLEVKPEPVSDDESDDDSSDSDMSEYEASKSDAESPSESDTGVKPVEDEGILSKPRKRVKRKYTGHLPGRRPSVLQPSHKKKVRANTTKEGMYIEPGSCTTTYESRRREVTRAELDRTMERARALETEFPSIPVLMMPSHVYRGFWLVMHLLFCTLVSAVFVSCLQCLSIMWRIQFVSL